MGSSIFVVQWERCDNCGLGKIPGGESYDVEACGVFAVSVYSSARMEEHGFESTLIADVLKAKGKGADGSWLRCTTDDSVYNAVKSISFYWTVTDEASDKHSHASGNCSTTDLTKQPTSMLSIWRPGLQRGTVESETEYNTEHHNNAPLMNRL
ncbi:hypothetical protein QYF36_016464 [Acer negundo]|nr:hypothetical protein QYF36_016464 [Acer negundo]